MKSFKISLLCCLVLCLCGCEEARQSPAKVSNSTDVSLYSDNSYIDGLEIHMINEFRSFMNDYQIKMKFEQDFESKLMPPITDPKHDLRALIFGSEENCIKAINNLETICRTVDKASYVFNAIIYLLDQYFPSYTFENYKESLPNREYIKYLISYISRYLKISNNALHYILSGTLIDDKDLVSAGFNILSQENILFDNKKTSHIYSKIERHTPKNLKLLFKKINQDTTTLYKEIHNIENLYNKICASVVNKKEGQTFIKNQKHIRNLCKNLKSFSGFLYNLSITEKLLRIFDHLPGSQ